jgi:hypothetical protein
LQAHVRNCLRCAGNPGSDYNVAPTEIDIHPTTSWDDAVVQPESRSRSPTVVPKVAITDPAHIDLWAIEKAPCEPAYAVIERIGSERFIRNFGALKAHEHETGILWHRPMVGPLGSWVWSCMEVRTGRRRSIEAWSAFT